MTPAVRRIAGLLLAGIVLPAGAAPAGPAVRRPTPVRPAAPSAPLPKSFLLDVLPVLTRAGCNSGACHGSATGRGGFRLSLIAGDPGADYRRITQEYGGRRVDHSNPPASLLLRKASAAVPHGGGRRLAVGTAAYERVRAWIAAGSPEGGPGDRLEMLEVIPGERLAPSAGSVVQLAARVRARYDGEAKSRTRDVTRDCLFTANDPGIASVAPDGRVTVHRPGVGVVMVRYLGALATARVGLPFGPRQTAPAADPSHPVDRVLAREWRRLGLTPSRPAPEQALLRRLTLDLAGRLPTVEEASTFHAAQAGTRVEALIERLLGAEDFVDAWTWRLGELLLLDSKRHGEAPARAYHAWLRERIRDNRPLDVIVHELITARGPVDRPGPAAFYRTYSDPRDQAEFVSRALFGYRVACARCHNHPLDRWTQDQYYAFAATFARVRLVGNGIVEQPEGELPHPDDGEPVRPAPLGELGYPSPSRPGEGRTEALAAWLQGPGRRLLALSLANRLWQAHFGRGVVEPVDDLRPTNPPSVPHLLETLAAELMRQEFDLHGFVRWLVESAAYRASSEPAGPNANDDRHFSRAQLKPLLGPVLVDAIAQATGTTFEYPGQPQGARALQLPDARTPSYTLDVLGRCRRDGACEPGGAEGGLAGALHLLNSPEIGSRLGRGRIARLMNRGEPPRRAVEELYLATLARYPNPGEAEHWARELARGESPREVLEDLLWGLLHCREFSWNH